MDKIPFQEYLKFEDTSYIASTSLVLDKKNGNWNEYYKLVDFLNTYLEVYNKAYHIALSELCKNKDFKDIKRRICKELNVKSRVADSAINEARAKLSAKKELLKVEKQEVKYAIKKAKAKLKKEKEDYKEFREEHKDWSKPAKKIVVENKKYRKNIYFLKDKINKLNVKLKNIEKTLKDKKYKICFGGKKLLSYRHKLENEKTKYNTYEEWNTEWNKARKKHIFTVGTTGDSYGNQLLKLIPSSYGYYYLRITDYRNTVKAGTYFEFPVYLSYLEGLINNYVSNNQTMSYYIVKEKDRFYIKPSVEIKGVSKCPVVEGCYGIDINNGFLSITKTDKNGRFIKTEDIIFETEGSREQNIESLNNILLNTHRKAKKENYSIAIEGINLTRKKIVTGGKKMNRILHLFPYSRYVELSKRMSVKTGTNLYLVHPAYTSQLGDEKYKDVLRISRHQSAAYVIGRRALGFEEKYKK